MLLRYDKQPYPSEKILSGWYSIVTANINIANTANLITYLFNNLHQVTNVLTKGGIISSFLRFRAQLSCDNLFNFGVFTFLFSFLFFFLNFSSLFLYNIICRFIICEPNFSLALRNYVGWICWWFFAYVDYYVHIVLSRIGLQKLYYCMCYIRILHKVMKVVICSQTALNHTMWTTLLFSMQQN